VSTVQDMTDTGDSGYSFLKLDSGMTEILRPSLYAAQHPFFIFSPSENEKREAAAAAAAARKDYVIVGHCCESGDLGRNAENQGQTYFPNLSKGTSTLVCDFVYDSVYNLHSHINGERPKGDFGRNRKLGSARRNRMPEFF
jgi:diaminopimelate decarboxylase